ncbi:MAG: S-layer homology domain-containing protein, partial [Firmicutes bacterium]|nr:S-layer homology domain-containing protein [Bacillota bacterium]
QYIIDFYKNDPYPYGDMFYPYESGTFKWYYRQYIDAAKAKGMIPVVITPVCRVFFDENGKITPHFGEDNGYIEAVRQIAKENNCTLIDMYEITSALYESYGELSTQVLHNVKADGSMDLTHYNKFGANIIASKMAESLKAQNVAIAKDTKNSNVLVGKFDALKEANLFVIGDVLADKTSKTEIIKSVSFADKLPRYFSDKIHVIDYTMPDCTAKSFTKTKEYSDFMSKVNPGDYVILAFGRTDGDKSSTDSILDRYSDPDGAVEKEGSFRYYLYNYYIKPLHDKNAVMIGTTPMISADFKGGKAVNDLGGYSAAVRELISANYLYFVDMNGQTEELFNKMGAEGSKAFNAIDSKKGIERDRLNDFGADTMARTFVSMMKYSSATLKTYINEAEFSKADTLTRGEFTRDMTAVLGVSDTSGENFKDVTKGKDYYDAVLTAKNLKLTPGYVSGSFKPENEIYGNDAVNMLKAALKKKGKKITALNDVYELMPIDKTVSNEIGLYAIARLYEETK